MIELAWDLHRKNTVGIVQLRPRFRCCALYETYQSVFHRSPSASTKNLGLLHLHWNSSPSVGTGINVEYAVYLELESSNINWVDTYIMQLWNLFNRIEDPLHIQRNITKSITFVSSSRTTWINCFFPIRLLEGIQYTKYEGSRRSSVVVTKSCSHNMNMMWYIGKINDINSPFVPSQPWVDRAFVYST